MRHFGQQKARSSHINRQSAERPKRTTTTGPRLLRKSKQTISQQQNLRSCRQSASIRLERAFPFPFHLSKWSSAVNHSFPHTLSPNEYFNREKFLKLTCYGEENFEINYQRPTSKTTPNKTPNRRRKRERERERMADGREGGGGGRWPWATDRLLTDRRTTTAQ